jgi:hypothetical protein
MESRWTTRAIGGKWPSSCKPTLFANQGHAATYSVIRDNRMDIWTEPALFGAIVLIVVPGK